MAVLQNPDRITASGHIHGYLALPVRYKDTCENYQWLYCKEHSVRDKNEAKPASRTLFVINIPGYYTSDCVKRIFRKCGKIDAIYFHQNPTGGLPIKDTSKYFPVEELIKGYKVGYVVFHKITGLKAALGLSMAYPFVIWPKDMPGPKNAVERWKAEYDAKITNSDELEKEVEDYMKKFDTEIQEQEKELKEKSGEPDEEGWITVTRRGRKPGFARKESVEQKLLEKESKKKKKRQLTNFYRFQVRESEMKKIAEFRRKFEEDKKKIETMRKQRRFRPY